MVGRFTSKRPDKIWNTSVKKLRVKEKYFNQYLTNEMLKGEVDEVLVLDDGTMAPLGYNFAKFEDKIYDTYKTQIDCYAWLITTNYHQPVKKGYLVYTRSQNKLIEIPVAEEHIEKIASCAAVIREIIQKNIYPKATKSKRRCLSCTYRDICTK
ncbi:MAG: CRISPR-associated exonuclease Cas4 [Saprospiraceae bacterium]